MGHIITDLKNAPLMTRVIIERHVDEIELQKLQFILDKESFIGTEGGGASLSLFGRDHNGNIVEILIPISPEELKKSLDNYVINK